MDYSHVSDPHVFLALKTLDMARKDASSGSVEALNWLDDTGAEIADCIEDGFGYMIKRWVRSCTERLLNEGVLWVQLELVPDNV